MGTRIVHHDSTDIPILVCSKGAPLSSQGVFFGAAKTRDMPFDCVMPLFFFHVIVVVFISRIFFFFLRRFKQPRIVSDVLVRTSDPKILHACVACMHASVIVLQFSFPSFGIAFARAVEI